MKFAQILHGFFLVDAQVHDTWFFFRKQNRISQGLAVLEFRIKQQHLEDPECSPKKIKAGF